MNQETWSSSYIFKKQHKLKDDKKKWRDQTDYSQCSMEYKKETDYLRRYKTYLFRIVSGLTGFDCELFWVGVGYLNIFGSSSA